MKWLKGTILVIGLIALAVTFTTNAIADTVTWTDDSATDTGPKRGWESPEVTLDNLQIKGRGDAAYLTIGEAWIQGWTVGSGGESWSGNVSFDKVCIDRGARLLNGYNPAHLLTQTNHNIYRLDSQAKKSAARFTAQHSKTVVSVSINYAYPAGTPPTYKVGIQADNNGDPTGTYLGYGTFQKSDGDWVSITLNPSVSLTKGEVYHIVMEWDSGTVDSSNYGGMMATQPAWGYVQYNENDPNINYPDSNLKARYYDGSNWYDFNSLPTPSFILEYSDGTLAGQPSSAEFRWEVYGERRWGEEILISGVDKTVTSIGTFLEKIGTPADDIYYEIRNAANNNVLASGVLATANEVSGSAAWYDASLSSHLTLLEGNTYIVDFYSPNSDEANYFRIYCEASGDKSEEISFGGATSHGVHSGDGGSNWGDMTVDFPFRLQLVEATSGSITSIAKDAEAVGEVGGVWQKISFTGTVPANTSVDIQVCSSDDNSTWSDWTTVQSSATPGTVYDIPLAEQKQYGKWKLVLNTTDTSVTPEIESVTFTCSVGRVYLGGSYDGHSVAGTTSDVAVGFGTATKVAFTTQPSGAVAGVAFTTQPVVAIQDVYGNTVLTATDDVTVSISNDPTEGDKATLSGTTTLAASSGVATFTDLSIDEPGIGYTLQAASGALTTDTSSTFNVGGAPWVTSVSALQLTDGSKKVRITYTACDVESDSCNVTAAAQAQYSQDNSTWNNATLSGTTTGITTSSDGIVHSDLYWEAGTDLNNTEDSTVYFRLKLNDGTYTSPSYSTSSAFVLDTKAPVVSSATSFSSTPQAGDTTITLTSTWTDSNYSSAVSYFYYALDGETYSSANAGTSGSLTPSATIDLGTTLTGHSYFSKIKSTLTDDYGNTSTSEDTTDVGVVPYTPPAPTVQNQKQTSLDVIVNKNASEASGLEYAIYISPAVDGYNYVQTDGTVGASAAWQTISDWGTKTVVGLAKETVYNLRTKSRNADVTSVESDWSNTASLSTLSAGMTFALEIDYLYDVSNDAIKFLVWLTLGGEKVVCTSSDTAVVNIYDSSGTKLNSSALTSSSPDAQGTFSLTWDPADGTGFTTDVNYYAQAQITHGGATYYDTLTFNINEAKRISEILTDTGTTLPATLTTIEGKIDTIDTVVDSILEDTGTTLPATLTTIEGKIDTIDSIVDDILVDTGTTLSSTITTAKSDIIAELDKGPKAKILNRETTVETGDEITIRYKTDSGLSPVIDVYDADNTKRVNAASMTEIGSTGVYEYDLTLESGWGTGDFTIICSESTNSSIDSMILTVTSAATAGGTIGTPEDVAGADTLFGKIAQVYEATSVASTASTYAQNAYNEIQDLRDELDFEDKTSTAYKLMLSLSETLSELKEEIGKIPSEVATPSPDKIAASITEALSSLKGAAALAGYKGAVAEMKEEEVVDLTTLKNQLAELKALVEIIKGLIIEKEEKPVIKSWFEMG